MKHAPYVIKCLPNNLHKEARTRCTWWKFCTMHGFFKNFSVNKNSAKAHRCLSCSSNIFIPVDSRNIEAPSCHCPWREQFWMSQMWKEVFKKQPLHKTLKGCSFNRVQDKPKLCSNWVYIQVQLRPLWTKVQETRNIAKAYKIKTWWTIWRIPMQCLFNKI